MRNNFRAFLFILLLPFLGIDTVIGQNAIEGRIVSQNGNSPIPYANIWIIGTNYGTTSNENGQFRMDIDKLKDEAYSLKISSIGNLDTTIRLSELGKLIKLRSRNYELSEVKVFPQKKKEMILNDLRKEKLVGGFMEDSVPKISGYLFDYQPEYSECPYLKKIRVYTCSLNRSKFNLRIYSFDAKAKRPIDELVHENILVQSKGSFLMLPKCVEIDVSKYKIKFPKEGLLVGVEYLIIPENRYTITYTIKDKKDKKRRMTCYGPDLSACSRSECMYWKYESGEWFPFPLKTYRSTDREHRYDNPAVSVVLMN